MLFSKYSYTKFSFSECKYLRWLCIYWRVEMESIDQKIFIFRKQWDWRNSHNIIWFFQATPLIWPQDHSDAPENRRPSGRSPPDHKKLNSFEQVLISLRGINALPMIDSIREVKEPATHLEVIGTCYALRRGYQFPIIWRAYSYVHLLQRQHQISDGLPDRISTAVGRRGRIERIVIYRPGTAYTLQKQQTGTYSKFFIATGLAWETSRLAPTSEMYTTRRQTCSLNSAMHDVGSHRRGHLPPPSWSSN